MTTATYPARGRHAQVPLLEQPFLHALFVVGLALVTVRRWCDVSARLRRRPATGAHARHGASAPRWPELVLNYVFAAFAWFSESDDWVLERWQRRLVATVVIGLCTVIVALTWGSR